MGIAFRDYVLSRKPRDGPKSAFGKGHQKRDFLGFRTVAVGIPDSPAPTAARQRVSGPVGYLGGLGFGDRGLGAAKWA